jgi:hypothetical protein
MAAKKVKRVKLKVVSDAVQLDGRWYANGAELSAR